MKLVEGKLYRVTRPLSIITEEEFKTSTLDIMNTKTLDRGSVFIFVGTLKSKFSKCSKILFEDKIFVTQSPYFISDSITRHGL